MYVCCSHLPQDSFCCEAFSFEMFTDDILACQTELADLEQHQVSSHSAGNDDASNGSNQPVDFATIKTRLEALHRLFMSLPCNDTDDCYMGDGSRLLSLLQTIGVLYVCDAWSHIICVHIV